MSDDVMKVVVKEYEELSQKIQELKAETQAKTKDVLKSLFADFFVKYDEVVEHLFWTQFTPFFNDGDACEFSVNSLQVVLRDDEEMRGEGSTLYDANDITKYEKILESFIEWEKDKLGAAEKHKTEYMKKHDTNPFAFSWNKNFSEHEQMMKWTPYYGFRTIEEVREFLQKIKNQTEKNVNLKDDFEKLKKFIALIDDDIMLHVFGNHSKVIVTRDNIRIEEYTHD